MSDLITWLQDMPVVTNNDPPVSYQTIELISLSIGLPMHDLNEAQFQEDSSILPPHVASSPLEFNQYDTLSQLAEAIFKHICNGYAICSLDKHSKY